MFDFIVKYWIEELFALIIAFVAWLTKQVKCRKKEYGVLNEAIMALLHDRLYRSCRFFLARGYCSIEDRNNLECLYTPYKALGGNGTGEQLYKKVLELPYALKEKTS